jgi:endo-1,4-beta-xylanase
MKLAHMTFESVLLPACMTLAACSASSTTDHPGSGGTMGVGAGGHAAGNGGSGNLPSGGTGNGPSGGTGNTSFAGAGALAGAGGSWAGSSGQPSSAGAGNGPNGGSGNASFGGTGGKASGGAGGKANGGAGGKANGGAGGSGGGSGGAPALDCAAPMPSGGTVHTSKNQSGKAGGLDWTIWSNGTTAGSITTYESSAFSAAWGDSSASNASGDFLARIGLQWNASKTYDQLGTITAQFAAKKSGTAGGYSYIGIYGWSVSPCVEWYIVDDSYNKMPVNPGSTTNMGTATIDGGMYTFYKRSTNGTGGSKCGSQTTWDQYYSIRNTARECGQISISEHFAKWTAASMPLGKMDQAQILVEVGGGLGKVDFPVASVTATP